MSLLQAFDEEKPTFDPAKLKRYLLELEKRKANYPKLKISVTEKVDEAIARAKQLVSIHREFERDIVIVLQSKNQYEGLKVWDALQSAGLKWGDGDLFHWNNNFEYGSDMHFSVWTSTSPGYFLPEEIKKGNMNPADLVFGFSIPRSADPVNIYNAMLDVANYCRQRIGGTLLNEDGKPLNELNEKLNLKSFVSKIKAAGIEPGSDNALMMFLY